MAKSKAEPEPAPAPKATGAASVLAWLKLRRRKRDNAQANKGKGKGDGTRETFESIAVAFLAAFMFRTFLAEAFVIPTGSMAPTLFGRHKDVECPECGTLFQVGASDEVRPPSGNQVEERNWLSGLPVSGSAFLYPKHRLLTSFCPNCRTEINVKDLPVFTGDRILVNKWPFEFSDPDRWDVVVFKYPEEPQTNYIKRLVGLPGEQIEIERGDVYARDEDGVRTILRKHPGKQRDLRLPVYDDTKPPVALLKAGWPERWQGLEQDDDARSGWAKGGDGWSLDAESRSYRLAAGDDRRWLRYRHFVPTPDDWELLPDVEQPTPKLVTDFLAYNTYTGGAMAGFGPDAVVDGRYWSGYWVGDLALDAHVEVESAAGELVLELNEGFRRYRATVDLATGEATVGYLEEGLDRDEPVETTLATATTRMRSPGTYRVEFANVDQRLDLWIDGSLVTFDGETTYSPSPLPGPARGDLSPAGIAVTGTAATVDRLKLYRDVYYRAEEVGVPAELADLLTVYDEMIQRFINTTSWRVRAFLTDVA